jgi:indole-3-glycerol phosphate synthase
MAGNILDDIVASKRREVETARAARSLDSVCCAAAEAPPPRDFWSAVATSDGLRPRLIAEIKQSSPSAGLIRRDFDAVAIARTYESAGAAALSVLTDGPYFGGSLELLGQVKRATGLPVLRKDFLIDEYQVHESRAAGADAVLLIAAILDDERLSRFTATAHALGMTTLLEVHDERELRRAMPLFGVSRRVLAGINNRDLAAQRIDLETTERLAGHLPRACTFVAESGMKTREDVLRMARAGASAVLIGETLLRAESIDEKVQALLGTNNAI